MISLPNGIEYTLRSLSLLYDDAQPSDYIRSEDATLRWRNLQIARL